MVIIFIKALCITVVSLLLSYFGIKFISKHMKNFLIILGSLTFCACIGLDIYFGKFYEKNETALKVSEEIKREIATISNEFDIHDHVIKNSQRKEGVNPTWVSSLDTALYEIIGVYRKILNNPSYMPLITSANDYNGHSKNSAHYRGEAVDIRIKDLNKTDKKNIIDALKTTLGKGFSILYEDEGKPNEHLHVQLKKG